MRFSTGDARFVTAAAAPPIPTTPSWGNGQLIYWDPANASTCASDNNNCLSSTCSAGGVGPCATYAQIAARWGTYSPYFNASTTLTAMSSCTSLSNFCESDPVIWMPYINATNSGVVPLVQMVGALTATNQRGTGTLGTVTSKNRSTNTSLSVSGFTVATGSLPQSGDLLVNSTHTSVAAFAGGGSDWIYQPQTNTGFVANSSAALNYPLPSEVDTWATGDSYTAYARAGINAVLIRPTLIEPSPNSSSTFTPLVIQNLTFLYPPAGNGFLGGVSSQLDISGQVLVADCNIQKVLVSRPWGSSWTAARFVDNFYYFPPTIQGGPAVPTTQTVQPTPQSDNSPSNEHMLPAVFGGGTQISNGIQFNALISNTWLDNDVMITEGPAVNVTLQGTIIYGCVAIGDTGKLVGESVYAVPAVLSAGGACSTNAIVWASGISSTGGSPGIYLGGTSRWSYKGATAVNTFLGVVLRLNDRSSTGCSHSNANNPDVQNCAISLTPANLDAAQGTAGFGGLAFIPGGSSFSSNL